MAERELIINEYFNPLYGVFIIIPPRTLFWRGYNASFPSISTRPAYYSSKEIAKDYVRNKKKKTNSTLL